jgi:hypothetical protein
MSLRISNKPKRTPHSTDDSDAASDELYSDTSDIPAKAWPKDFFVVDVVKGFTEIDAGL